MKLIRKLILFTLISFIINTGFSQDIKVLSLDEAIAFGLENNYEVINSEKDVESAKARVRESTAMGLPQINGSIDYADNQVENEEVFEQQYQRLQENDLSDLDVQMEVLETQLKREGL